MGSSPAGGAAGVRWLAFWRRPDRLGIACTVSLLVFGCGGTIRAYGGDPRPPGEVATLTGEPSIRILEVDGHPTFGRSYEIVPGVHQVSFKVVFRGDEFEDTVAFKDLRKSCLGDAKFVAEPGVACRLVKISRSRRPAKSGIRGIRHRHEFGVALRDEGEAEPIPEAIAPLNCGS